MARQISGSVGINGKNAKGDVLTVQTLLNQTRGKTGGPPAPIGTDGVFGPETAGAINRFQSRNFGWSDGRVDPSGRTLATLNAFADLKGVPATASAKPIGGKSIAPQPSTGPAWAIDGSSKKPMDWALITSVSGKVKMRFPSSWFMPATAGFFLPPGGVLMTYDATGAPLDLPLTKEEFNSPYPWKPGSATLQMSDGTKRSLGPYCLFVVS